MKKLFNACIHTVALSVAVFVSVGIGSITTIPADLFLDRARFEQARFSKSALIDPKDCKNLRGALVNHHALASDLLWRLFQRLVICRPEVKRIIILSPDHFFQGRSPITTAAVRYEFRQRFVESDASVIAKLVREQVAKSDPLLFRREHGIGALIPFIESFFPEAKIVPIAIRSDVSQSETERLSEALKSLMDEQTLLIVSSDMSHYLPERTARQKDRETQRAFEASDAGFFWKAKDDHLDFGKGVWIALQTLSPEKFKLLDQGVSTSYGGSAAYTTTYFTGIWQSDR